MTEHGLQASQVGSTLQQVCRETVSKNVRRKVLPQTDLLAVIFQQLPECLPRHWTTPVGQKQVLGIPSRRLFAAALDVCLDRLNSRPAHGDQPLLATFPDDPH